jgi:molecular chaperone GrpE
MGKKKGDNGAARPEPATPQETTETGQMAGSETVIPGESAVQAGPSGEEELAAAKALAEKNWDLYLRSQADLENYRKRAQREKEDLARFANEAILREMLPVIDNLERAVAHAGNEQGSGGLLQGVEMTLGQFQKVLEKFGVTSIKAAGEPFNPAVHEAIGQVESGKHAPNTVVQEFQRGYLLNDRLLRPSLVMVTKAPAVPEE